MGKIDGVISITGDATDVSYKSTSETISGNKIFSGSVKTTGDLGFYGKTPIAQPTAPSAVDATEVVDLATAITVLASLRTSYNELVTKVKALGITAT